MAPSFILASDRSLLVSLGASISLEVHRCVVALTRSFETNHLAGVSNIHPAYCSVLIVFDPLVTDHDAIQSAVSVRLADLNHEPSPEPRTMELPVCYGGDHGPDLIDLAVHLGLTPERIVELHSSAEYTACFIGFVPGFAYLGGLPRQIEAPRLHTPRQKVPSGSVGIAGAQTGVYPFETPGGWRLIGRTPASIFLAGRNPMSLIQLGDRVRFVSIKPDEYAEKAQ
jgi:KipI family sensor histidine kinase inhibitor